MEIKIGDKVKLKSDHDYPNHLVITKLGKLTVRSIYDAGIGLGYEFNEVTGKYLAKYFEPIVPFEYQSLIDWHIKNINDYRVDLRTTHQQMKHFESLSTVISNNINKHKEELYKLGYKDYV